MSARGSQKVTPVEGSGPAPGEGPDRRLLEPGWAGELSDREIEYIQGELTRSRRLWRRWGYLGAMMKGVTIPTATIRRIAKHGLK